MSDLPRFLVGSSLKMYLGQKQTLSWVSGVAEIARDHPAVVSGLAGVFLLPSFPALVPAGAILHGSPVQLGAQDLFWHDSGAYTGEVSGAHLAEIGCTFVEVGHAERRNLLGETDEMVSAKTLAAFRNALTPVLCIGERHRATVSDAIRECHRQLESALNASREAGWLRPLVIAYEPVWAIGAAQAAEPDYIVAVVAGIREFLNAEGQLENSRVIYGGSAGPGLLSTLNGAVDGLFVGRFGHDPAAFDQILTEIWQLGANSKHDAVRPLPIPEVST